MATQTRELSSAPGTDRPVVLDVTDLAKHFRSVRAVDGISFQVYRGEVFALLGHNGAGKTTTIRMLTGRSRPTSGSARILGRDVVAQRDEVLPLLNVVPEDQNVYERLTGRANLQLFADLYRAPGERVDHLLERMQLSDAADRAVKTYSSGMKQRLVIARALINEPQVLFLDEPTRGLDPASAKELRTLIAELSAEGTTVLLTTHLMEEADDLSHRVAFLSHGRLVALDTPRELKLRHGERTATVLLRDRSEVTIQLDSPEDGRRLAEWMAGDEVLSVHSREGTLEDVFIALAGRPL